MVGACHIHAGNNETEMEKPGKEVKEVGKLSHGELLEKISDLEEQLEKTTREMRKENTDLKRQLQEKEKVTAGLMTTPTGVAEENKLPPAASTETSTATGRISNTGQAASMAADNTKSSYVIRQYHRGSIKMQTWKYTQHDEHTEHSQSAVVAPEQQKYLKDKKEEEEENLPRSLGSSALRARPEHFLVLRPILGEIKIFDVTTLKDLVINVDENGQASLVFKILNGLVWFWAIPSLILLIPLVPVYGPFSMLSLTGASRPLFDENYATALAYNVSGMSGQNSTRSVDAAAAAAAATAVWEPPWGSTWDSACLFMAMMACIAGTYFCLYMSMEIHPAVWKLTLEESRTQVVLALGLALVYAAASGSLLPDAMHVLWLVFRGVFVFFLIALDSILVFRKLRTSTKAHTRQLGAKGKKGWVSILLIITCVVFFFIDIFRHWLVLFVSGRVNMFQFGLQNPLTGSTFALSNHQLADACFYTNMVMIASVAVKIAKSHAGAETVLLTTKFACW